MVKRKAAAKKAVAKKTAKAAPKRHARAKPAPPADAAIATEPEDPTNKATGAIGVDVQDHTGPIDALAERTIRSLQTFTVSHMAKGPYQTYRASEGSEFDTGETIKACRISGLFKVIDIDGEEITCVDGYFVRFEDGSLDAMDADRLENGFDLVDPDPKN